MRVKNTERKENKGGGAERPKMACRQPRATVCQHPTNISNRLQTPLKALVCFLSFSFGQEVCPERTRLPVPATRLHMEDEEDSSAGKVTQEDLQSEIHQTVYLASPAPDTFPVSNQSSQSSDLLTPQKRNDPKRCFSM